MISRLGGVLLLAGWGATGSPAAADPLLTLAQDPRLHLVMHPPQVVIGHNGRQPNLFSSSQGTLFAQAQLRAEPFHSKPKFVFPALIGSAISRDRGATWTRWTHQEGHDDVNIEGGMVECADHTILLFDTYVTPSGRKDHGTAEIWKSHDDLHTIDGPDYADVYLPTVQFNASTDDRGQPHAVARLHRSVLEMPNGDLLALIYGWFAGDNAPSAFLPSMKRSRTVVVRSRDRGASWAYLSTVGVDSGVGTEGFNEGVFVRITRGPHAGRLLCLMRTGRDLYGAHSDDAGLTWTRPLAVHFPGIDIYATEKWERLFVDPRQPGYVPTDELIGALVDPDLIEMRDGTLVCAIGGRFPALTLFENWKAPQNGDYLAFSLDGGATWSHVVQFLSGQPTTHYIGIREVAPGLLYVVYDTSLWHYRDKKLIAPGETLGFQLEVRRSP